MDGGQEAYVMWRARWEATKAFIRYCIKMAEKDAMGAGEFKDGKQFISACKCIMQCMDAMLCITPVLEEKYAHPGINFDVCEDCEACVLKHKCVIPKTKLLPGESIEDAVKRIGADLMSEKLKNGFPDPLTPPEPDINDGPEPDSKKVFDDLLEDFKRRNPGLV
jgi:hypothetical protein